nr:uncharacterized protein LOC111416972 [Onthophagus taurus]
MPQKLNRKLRNVNESYLEVNKDQLDELPKSKTSETIKNKYLPATTPQKPPVTQSALIYEASDRIKEMAAPKRRKGGVDLVPGAVKPTALKHQTTKRDYELASPRVWKFPKGVHIKDHPEIPSKAAMKYVATPRIIELAKPAEKRF